MAYQRPIVEELKRAIAQYPHVIHVVAGPRQVGKTTAASQVLPLIGGPSHFAAADLGLPPGPEWLETQWRTALALATAKQGVTLVLDEIQKIPRWSEEVKRLWDESRRSGANLRLLLLGSSALLLQHGLTESLAGRFFLHRCGHWTLPECRDAFGWDLERWLHLGGYPGAAPFAKDLPLWRRYIADSLVDTVLARDIFQLQNVGKPALMRNLFGLAVTFPAQIVSYNKMLGQLQEAGNTTTLAHYVQLLSSAFLLSGLEAFSVGQRRKRGSSPKLVLWNNALISAFSGTTSSTEDATWRGRLVENAVGAHLLNLLPGPEWNLTYWRHRNEEVDYVLQHGRDIFALEVKSGRPSKPGGFAGFLKEYPKARCLVVGSGGIPLEDFFSRKVETWFS